LLGKYRRAPVVHKIKIAGHFIKRDGLAVGERGVAKKHAAAKKKGYKKPIFFHTGNPQKKP
jgi:hypothetical protein